MKLVTINQFLRQGGGQLPGGNYRAAAIHPSSDCDLAIVGGRVLGVGGIVPASATSKVTAVRWFPTDLEQGDDADDAEGSLVLALYEDCDALVSMGSRTPVGRRAVIAAADLPATAATAVVAFRLPFQGRSQATISFARNTGVADMTMVPVGIIWGDRRVKLNWQDQVYTAGAAETWWNGAGAAPTVGVGVTMNAELAWRTVHIGGDGDAIESFDELAIYVYGGAGGGAAYIEGQSFGERIQ